MAQARNRNQGFGLRVGGSAESDGPSRKRARREVASGAMPTVVVPSNQGRRLSGSERRALQERRRARMPGPEAPPTASPRTEVGDVERSIGGVEDVGFTEAAAPERANRFVRHHVAAPPTPRKAAPRMPRTVDRPAGPSRGLVAVGAVFIVGLAVLALAGGRIFGAVGGGGDEPPRTGVSAAPMPTGLPQLTLASPAAGGAAVPRLAPIGTPKAAAFAGGRAPIVCLDPGHGGPDDGFNPILTDAAPDFTESVLVLQHAWDLEARLKLRGFEVVMTRRTDTAVNPDRRDVNGDGKTARDDRPDPNADPGRSSYGNLDELQARINVCNEGNADLLVSMHVNGYSTEAPYGPEAWFTREREFGRKNEAFAGRAYTSLKEELTGIGYQLPEPERGVSPDSALTVDTEHAMLKHLVITGPAVKGKVDPSRMPGAVIETLFISNPVDAEVLASPIGREAIVSGYENAIVEYFADYPPDRR